MAHRQGTPGTRSFSAPLTGEPTPALAHSLTGISRNPLTTPVLRWYPPVLEYPVRHNGFAVVGATLGSAALAVSLLPLLGMVSWILAPAGMVLSAVGLLLGFVRHAGRMGALLGIATSSIALAICLAWVLLAQRF